MEIAILILKFLAVIFASIIAYKLATVSEGIVPKTHPFYAVALMLGTLYLVF